jgi:putative ABC transport system permease protein
VARVQAGLFSALGERPFLGRLPTTSDEAAGAPAVAIVSLRFFQQRFGGDPRAVGSPIQIVSGPITESVVIVGVLPERLSRIVPSGVIMPTAPSDTIDPRARLPVRVIGLLPPGLTVAQAQVMLESRPAANPAWRLQVVSLRDSVVGAEVGRVLKLLFGAVGLLLLIACANVANLLLARLADRGREMAIRAAVGADRWRLGRQLLTESLMLAIFGAVVGLLLARITRPLLISLMPARTPGLGAIAIDGRVLAFTTLAAVVTALVAGLWPVLRLSRARAERVLSGRMAAGITRAGTSRALLAVEIGLALTIMVVAGTLVRSFVNLVSVDPGFTPENVIIVRTAGGPAPRSGRDGIGRFGWNPAQLDQGTRVLDELRRLPAVDAAGGVSILPLGEGATYTIGFEGRDTAGEDPWVGYQRATPGYFEAMGIPLRRGRLFTADDRDGAPGAVIVNDFAARRFWPGEDPIGRRVFLGSQEPLTVIGIVGDVRQRSLASEPRPEVYRSWLQEPDRLIYVVRTLDKGLLRRLSAPGATLGIEKVLEVRTVDDHVMGTIREPRGRMLLFVIARKHLTAFHFRLLKRKLFATGGLPWRARWLVEASIFFVESCAEERALRASYGPS